MDELEWMVKVVGDESRASLNECQMFEMKLSLSLVGLLDFNCLSSLLFSNSAEKIRCFSFRGNRNESDESSS